MSPLLIKGAHFCIYRPSAPDFRVMKSHKESVSMIVTTEHLARKAMKYLNVSFEELMMMLETYSEHQSWEEYMWDLIRRPEEWERSVDMKEGMKYFFKLKKRNYSKLKGGEVA